MNFYLLFKSLHLIAVISWMVGLLYLPRIFVYHVENYEKKEATEIFEIMERKLYFYIMRPAMIATWLFGNNFNLYKRFRYFFAILDAYKVSFGHTTTIIMILRYVSNL